MSQSCRQIIIFDSVLVRRENVDIADITVQSDFSIAGRFIFSDKLIVVAMFSYSGGTSSEEKGDPSMILVTPISAYQSRYVHFYDSHLN